MLALSAHADDPLPIIAQGIWQVKSCLRPATNFGFGYDPLFGYRCTKSAAEMQKTDKTASVMRASDAATANAIDKVKDAIDAKVFNS